MNYIKHHVPFNRVLRYILVTLSGIGLVLLAVLAFYLFTYEKNHPQYIVNTIVEAYKAKDFKEIIKKSDKAQQEDLKKALPNIVDKDKIFSFQSFEDKDTLEYTIVNKNQKLSTIVLKKETNANVFGIKKLHVQEINHFASYPYKIHYFANSEVMIDGTLIPMDSSESKASTNLQQLGMEEIVTNTYTYDSFEPISTISATYQGIPCTKRMNQNGLDISLYPSIPATLEDGIEQTLQVFSKEYARYTTLRGVAGGTLLQYVVPNSTLAYMITSYSNSWGEVIVSEEFSAITMTNPIMYYDGIYSYDVHLEYRVVSDNGEKKNFPIDYRMFVRNIGYGNQVFDMERVSKEESKMEGDGNASLLASTIQMNQQAIPSVCLDGDVTSGYQFLAQDTLHIKSDDDIGAIYITWASAPNKYKSTMNQQKQTHGKDGFIHELIKVDDKVKEVTLDKLEGNTINEIAVYSKGALPSDVQDWKTPYKQADIVAFPTHGDDDTLYMGALISEYVAKGKRIQLVFMTNHNDVADRPHEQLDGMWEMGLRTYPIIGTFQDILSYDLEHAKSLYDTQAMLAFQVENIRRFKPDIIIGHDENGEYGHGVHMLNTMLLKEAIQRSNDETYDIASLTAYGVHEPKKTYFHLYPQHVVSLDVHKQMEELNGRSPFEVATSAFLKHVSQLQYDLAVEDFGIGDCRLFGLYQSSVGYDFTTNDIFDGID